MRYLQIKGTKKKSGLKCQKSQNFYPKSKRLCICILAPKRYFGQTKWCLPALIEAYICFNCLPLLEGNAHLPACRMLKKINRKNTYFRADYTPLYASYF